MTTQTKKAQRQANLENHYARCERLGKYLGTPNPSGKKISTALLKIEKQATSDSIKYCNGDYDGGEWTSCKHRAECMIKGLFGKLPPGFFVNGDPRGYALKIDNEQSEALHCIATVGLETDWGGYGILSPKIA